MAIRSSSARRSRSRTRAGRSSSRAADRLGGPARALYRGLRGGLHGFLSRFTGNEALYSNLDIKYLGPVDGHDERAMEEALRQAKDYGAPVIVHAITDKGRGYEPARRDVADQFHAVGQIDPETGETLWMYRIEEGIRWQKAPRQFAGRGLSYWTDGREERVIVVTPGYHMVSLDAKTGRPDPRFGRGGVVDLQDGHG